MNKAERIERISGYLADFSRRVRENKTDLPEAEALMLLAFLATLGAVWVADDEKMPANSYSQEHQPDVWAAYEEGQDDMLLAGWRKVEEA